MRDGELVRRTLNGCASSREALVRRWSAPVLAFCRARTYHRQLAEDLAQETMLRGLMSLPSLEDPERLGSWLRGIAVRVCRDWKKAKQASQTEFSTLGDSPVVEQLLAQTDEALEQLEQSDEFDKLAQAVGDLPEELREVIMLYYYQDSTYQDLAEMLDVSTATINARLSKARATLRQKLGARQLQ